MCIIIDANVAHTFGDPIHEDAVPILKWLLKPRCSAMLVVGGSLTDELYKSGEPIRRLLKTLYQAGRLRTIKAELLQIEQQKVMKLLKADGLEEKMNDPHIIALAKASGSRLLFSRDYQSHLHSVFTDRKYLQPPDKVYQTKKHTRLLRSAPKCSPSK